MAPELIYMLKVNAGIALFYAFYKLFCCRDTFFQWRRMALMAFLAISFLYPALNFQSWIKEQPAMNDMADYYAVMVMSDGGATVEIPAGALTDAPTPDIMQIGFGIYIAGIILLILRFIVQCGSIFRLAVNSKAERIGTVRIRSLNHPANPFSFFRWIFIYIPDIEAEEMKEIITHEQTHVRQWHSLDVIASELIGILCWPNPFMWLLKAEIRQNLEYLADHKVVESGADSRRYQYHLLGLANQKRQTGLYNNFNLSHLKNRIIMMNKKRTNQTGRIKYALFAPLTAALLLISNIEVVARTAERLLPSSEETSSVANALQTNVTEGIVTYHITVTNSEGKPQPNVTLQTKNLNELKTFKTDANGKAAMELEMGNLKYIALAAFVESNPKKYQTFVVSPQKTEQTVILDTDADVTAFKKAGKTILVKLRLLNNDNETLAGATLAASDSKKSVKTNEKGVGELRVAIGETIAIKAEGYEDKTYEVKSSYPLADMTEANTVLILRKGEKPIFQVVQEMPSFPGGMEACIAYIAKNVQYPEKAKTAGTQGKVIIQFIVETDGSLTHPAVVRSISPELDVEAIRIVETMPKWTPGKQRGEAVRCKYTVPIAFTLE